MLSRRWFGRDIGPGDGAAPDLLMRRAPAAGLNTCWLIEKDTGGF